MLATTRDAMYGWTAERLVRKQAALGVPAYLYIFDHGYPAADDLGLHAFHASALPYVFGTADRTPPRSPKVPNYSADLKLSEALRGYRASLAPSALPKAADQPAWPAFAPAHAHMNSAAPHTHPPGPLPAPP